MDDALREKIDRLPEKPGVYVMRDREGEVIYVGKAVDVRARVRQYFNRSSDNRIFVPMLEEIVGDIETLVTTTEKEALLLENELIKRHQPRFNVKLKDDKSFIRLRLDVKHPFPRLEVVRRAHKDGARYFGPYASASSIRETLSVINKHFQLRICSDRVLANRRRPCIQYQIKRCPAPCVLPVPPEEYGASVRTAIDFLEGRAGPLQDELRARMKSAAGAQRFEEAARLRDQLRAVSSSLERQHTVFRDALDQDAIGFHREGAHLEIEVLGVRKGRLQEGRAYSFKEQEFPSEELLSTFIDVYYDSGLPVPSEVLVPFELEDARAKEEWLSEKRGTKVEVIAPKRGDRARLVAMAGENARAEFEQKRRRQADAEEAIARLQRRLRLDRLPRRIECYDISTFQGTETVGSRVTFLDGAPDKQRYRHYKVKAAQDDFASMYEVLTRRLARASEDPPPDLLVVDGGKGQLNVALAVVRERGLEGRLDVVGLAKARVEDAAPRAASVEHSPERVFLPGVKDAIALRPNTSELHLMTRVRDEAHRFAITFHKKLRDARGIASPLDAVPGVGPTRKRALLRRFGSLKRVREASEEDLAAALGPKLGAEVHRALHAAPAAKENLAESETIPDAAEEELAALEHELGDEGGAAGAGGAGGGGENSGGPSGTAGA